MAKSNAILREVGQRTARASPIRAGDHDKDAITAAGASFEFCLVGFTEQPSLEELVALGRKRKIPVLEDLGNGALLTCTRLVSITRPAWQKVFAPASM